FVRVAVIAVCVFAVGVYTDANTLSLHDALPICVDVDPEPEPAPARDRARPSGPDTVRVRRAIGDGHARRGRRARLRRDASVRAGAGPRLEEKKLVSDTIFPMEQTAALRCLRRKNGV